MTNDKILFINSLVTDNKLDTEVLLKKLGEDSLSKDALTELFFKLLIKQPSKFNIVRVNKKKPFSVYVKNKNKRSSTMYNLLLHKGKPDGFADDIIKLYNTDFQDTRKILEYIDNLTGDDKVPYLKLFMDNLHKYFGNKGEAPLSFIKFVFTNYDTMVKLISTLKQEYGYIKLIGGETYSDLGRYDNINDLININHEYIQNADIGIDIGGGYMTPDVSRVFNKDMVCLDKTGPSNVLNIVEYTNFTDTYINKLCTQKWMNKDLIFDSIDDNYDKYFITSFGFINSTIGPRDYLKNKFEGASNYLITYMACERLCELIHKRKEVYCILWGRPTSRVNENKLLNIMFKDGRLVDHEVLSDPLSKDYSNNGLFGAEKVVVFI